MSWLVHAAVAVVYFGTAWLGLRVASTPGNVSALWPPSGVALAALLVVGPRYWPGVWLGAFATHVLAFPARAGGLLESWLGPAIIASMSTLAALVAARLVTRYAGGRDALATAPRVIRFSFSAATACSIAAAGGLLATSWLGELPSASMPRFVLTFWLGDLIGMLAVTPLVLRDEASRRNRGAAEWVAVLAATLLACQLLFGRPLQLGEGTKLPLTWTLVPPVIWAGMRLGGVAVALQTLLIHALASWATVDGLGLFAHGQPDTDLLLIDGLLLAVVHTGLLLAGATAQASRAQAGLEAGQRQLERKVKERTAELARTNAMLEQQGREREQLLHQLFAAQKQEAVGRLAGGVAHDFNNLLTVVSGEASMIGRAAPIPRVEDGVRAILAATQRASELTRQLLAVAGRPVGEPTLVDVAYVLAATRRLVRPLLPENVELDVESQAEGAHVRVDAAQLEQVLLNLCINARDAMPSGGRLRIAQHTRELDGAEAAARDLAPGRYVVIEVHDSGGGIAPNNVDRIFEPFFSTKPASAGSGLGLSIALGIAKRAQGALRVERTSEEGSVFALWLPYVEAPAREVAPTVSESMTVPRAPAATLLVAEDEPLLRRLVVSALESLGHRVLAASDGEEALAIARSHEGPIDLLVTDVVMPRVDGVALARELRARRPLRVMFMSGYHDQQAELRHEIVLAKPFTIEQLNEHVARALESDEHAHTHAVEAS